ncbi:hypothetical protein [Mesorhizobium sp. B2-7-2]|uniref:hypothetical protein n=1 Tax=Mesorhizobium sp. B2-7-2 TaxID=2589908 RepID=UPI00112A5857|nr:hypothetical protein [Mesorhizobium sp. B2-7-2]TPJ30155.1 hypothetical protein FJ425_05350 [Mesorhizobium sp. B2-7-2]
MFLWQPGRASSPSIASLILTALALATVLAAGGAATGADWANAYLMPARLIISSATPAAPSTSNERIRFEGTAKEETTVVRIGGASDGATTFSWKIDTTANAARHFPFESEKIAIWSDTTGSSVTATVEGIAASLPNNDEIWIEVEYPGSVSSPKSSFVRTCPADTLAAAAAVSTSTLTWGARHRRLSWPPPSRLSRRAGFSFGCARLRRRQRSTSIRRSR